MKNLPNLISTSTGLIFADDFKLFKIMDTRTKCIGLQEDFSSVVHWFKNIEINEKQYCQMFSDVVHTEKTHEKNLLYKRPWRKFQSNF